MGQALYRKYRSKSFDDVIGQDHITTVLKNSIKDNNLSHAYLFTGPRGVGKTSVARILAREANGLKDDNNFYPDIVEIDAASNRRIDEIRDLREKVSIAPSQLKYKVYIIDEVHMLTREAFNALLKTLEEPPEHAIFILATTDYHKVPDTIISRCIRLSFKPISIDNTVKHLKAISRKEKIDINEKALAIVAEHSEGSFRDAISLLDQISSFNKPIDESLVESMLGLPAQKSIDELFELISKGDTNKAIQNLEKIYSEGATPSKMISELSNHTRALLLKRNNFTDSDLIVFLEDLNKAYSFVDQRLGVEVALLKLSSEKYIEESPETPLPELKKSPEKPTVKASKAKQAEVTSPSSDAWGEALKNLKKDKSTIYGIARMAEASIDSDKVILNFKFAFHHKQMSQDKNKRLILEAFKSSGNPMKDIEFVLSEAQNKDISSNEPDKKADVSSLSNIFGSVEVLES